MATGVAPSDPPVKMSLFSANGAHSNVISPGHIKALPCSASFGLTPYLESKLLPAIIMVSLSGFQKVKSVRDLMK